MYVDSFCYVRVFAGESRWPDVGSPGIGKAWMIFVHMGFIQNIPQQYIYSKPLESLEFDFKSLIMFMKSAVGASEPLQNLYMLSSLSLFLGKKNCLGNPGEEKVGCDIWSYEKSDAKNLHH